MFITVMLTYTELQLLFTYNACNTVFCSCFFHSRNRFLTPRSGAQVLITVSEVRTYPMSNVSENTPPHAQHASRRRVFAGNAVGDQTSRRMAFVEQGEIEIAILVLLAHHCIFRTCELLDLRTTDATVIGTGVLLILRDTKVGQRIGVHQEIMRFLFGNNMLSIRGCILLLNYYVFIWK